MAIESLLLAALLSAGASDCAALEGKQPELRQLLQLSRSLREAAAKPEASFGRIADQAKSLAASAKASLPQLQAATCRAGQAELKRFERCLHPLEWSCESVPPDIDWSFLAKVKHGEDEDLALALGDAVLAGPANLFETCCGDFGCVRGGVAIPGSFYSEDTIGKLARLAGFESPLGHTALETLRRSADGVGKAACSCDELSVEDVAAASSNVAEAAKKASGPAAAALRDISRSLAKGLPKKRCRTPGG